MTITLQGFRILSSEDLFQKCHSLDMDKKRYSYADIPHKGNKIGTIDATSCLGIIYRFADGSVCIQHLDDRPLEMFFDKKPYEATLIGGCQINGTLEKNTKINLEKLFDFWTRHQFKIDVQQWMIGDGRSYETLCSDFVVDEDNVYLLNQGEVGRLNLEMEGKLIPEAPRRLVASLLDHRYFFVCRSHKLLELPALKNISSLYEFAQMIDRLDDETILQDFSSTSTLEPPYFCKLFRQMAAYIMAQKKDPPSLKVKLLKDQPVFALQGEIVMAHY